MRPVNLEEEEKRILCLWHLGKKRWKNSGFSEKLGSGSMKSVRRVKDDRSLVTKELKVGRIHGSPPERWVGRGERQCKTPKERNEETLRLVFWNFTLPLTVLLNRKDKKEKESHTKLGTEVGVNQLLRQGVILTNILFYVLTWTKPDKKHVLFKCILYILITLKILLTVGKDREQNEKRNQKTWIENPKSTHLLTVTLDKSCSFSEVLFYLVFQMRVLISHSVPMSVK